MPILPAHSGTTYNIIVLNFGGIGDGILFSPVIAHLRQQWPNASITLVLEDRSQAVVPLMDGIDEAVPLAVQKTSRVKLMFQLLLLLRKGTYNRQTGDNEPYNLVVSSGSSPFIAVLLFLSGIRTRVGFYSGKLSQWLLTVAAPLEPAASRKSYAGKMYASLSFSLLQYLQTEKKITDPQALQPHTLDFERLGCDNLSFSNTDCVPKLALPNTQKLDWAKALLQQAESKGPAVLLHPGVSRISIEKNILKSWPVASWVALAEGLMQHGAIVFLCGGPDDAEAVAAIDKALKAKGFNQPDSKQFYFNLYGQTKSLVDLAALIVQSSLLVAVDSSPMHIAVGYQTPLVAIFGPTDETSLLPGDLASVTAVSVKNLPCRPCLWRVRQVSCDNPVCLDVPVDAVLAAALKSLNALQI
ncbi:MAG: glycosyltransferase family 9 protein [Cyanobacteria bacterium P01_H01_bin.74]